MKTIKEEQNYKLPPLSKICQAFVRGVQYDVSIINISAEAMSTMDSKCLGLPNQFAVADGNLMLWPVPDKEYEIVVRYAPPIMEF